MPYQLLGQTADISVEPILSNNKHYVPLTEIVQALGGNVKWDQDTKTATATIGQWAAQVQEGETAIDVSGTPVTLTSAPVIEDGTMYVPWDFFRDAYGYTSSFNTDTQTLDIHL